MTITLDLSPLQELKIAEIARQKGVEPLEYVRGLLELKPSSILLHLYWKQNLRWKIQLVRFLHNGARRVQL